MERRLGEKSIKRDWSRVVSYKEKKTLRKEIFNVIYFILKTETLLKSGIIMNRFKIYLSTTGTGMRI